MPTASNVKKVSSKIKKAKKQLVKLNNVEKRARDAWVKGYKRYTKAVCDLVDIKRHGTQKEANLKKIIKDWENKSIELTKKRDVARENQREKDQELTSLKIEEANLIGQIESVNKETDDIINQVFSLTDNVVSALNQRNGYLTQHVYSRLFDEKGELRSQITFTNTEGTRRVVAMVNSIQLVRPDLASEAMNEIEKFFNRLQPKAELDDVTGALYELTKKLLVAKTKFKVGPDLYRFLGATFTKKSFPELRRAQDLLKESLRSEKTNSYIRIYKRKDEASKWEPIKQSI